MSWVRGFFARDTFDDSINFMRRFFIATLGFMLLHAVSGAQSTRFVIDDDEYLDKITTAGATLLQEGKLKSLDTLRSQVHMGRFAIKLPPVAREKLSPPDLCER